MIPIELVELRLQVVELKPNDVLLKRDRARVVGVELLESLCSLLGIHDDAQLDHHVCELRAVDGL